MKVKTIVGVMLSFFLLTGFCMVRGQETKEMEQITTNSPEALKFYQEGRKHHLNGNYKQSISLMEKAIEIDPEFAMAYRSMGSSYYNIGGLANREKATEYLKKAWEIARANDRITNKEKLVLEGQFYQLVEGDYPRAGEIYKKLVEEYPEDKDAHDFMGFYAYQTQDWDLAIKHYSLSASFGADHIGVFDNLGFAYLANGEYDKARDVYKKYIADISDDERMHQRIANSYVFEGKYEEALEAADKVLALNPEIYSKASIYHLQGDFDSADKEYKTWFEHDSTGWKMNGWRYQEFLYRTLGQYGKAKKAALAGLKFAEDNNLIGWKRIFFDILAGYDLSTGDFESVLEKAEFIWESATKYEIPGWQTNALWWKIKALLGQNNIEKALELAEKAKEILEDTPSTIDIRWYQDDLGSIEMKKENYPKAIALFSKVYELQGSQRTWIQPHAYILSNLASAYYLNGDLEMAKNEYKNILSLTTGRMRWGDLYVKSFYMLGKIFEQQGDTAKAIEHYEKFLSLWKDADPGLPEVADTRERLKALQ